MAGEGGEGVKKRPRPGEDPKTTSLWRPESQALRSEGYITTSTGSKLLKGDSVSKGAEHPAKNPKGHYINCCLDEMLEYNSRRWWEQSRFDVLQGKGDPISKAMRIEAGEACERWTQKVANLKQHIILIGCSSSESTEATGVPSWTEHVETFRTQNCVLCAGIE